GVVPGPSRLGHWDGSGLLCFAAARLPHLTAPLAVKFRLTPADFSPGAAAPAPYRGDAQPMIQTCFGLGRRPFPATRDHSCYYPATGHERALARLLEGLGDGEGVLLLTGAPGTGKTLLCHCLLERLGPDVSSAFLTNAHVRDRVGLLQALLYD